MTTSDNPTVCVPVKLDAFVLNPSVCSGPSKIAPITQPNYTFLRLDRNISVIQPDILDHVDLHATSPEVNNRIRNVATKELRRSRFGVYLHWMLPRVYRSGIAATSSANEFEQRRQQEGFSKVENNADYSTPNFRPVPTRWLIVRVLKSKVPANANIPNYQAFVIESDRLRNIDDLDASVDLEVDVSPFLCATNAEKDDTAIDTQAEIFIGLKTHAEGWSEKGDTAARVPLSILHSSNSLFPDYQPHNSNVFSMLDNFEYDSTDPATGTITKAYLTQAEASYYVLGWHPKPEDDPFNMQPTAQQTHAARLDACMMSLGLPSSAPQPSWLEETGSARILCHGAMYNVSFSVDAKPAHVPADDAATHFSTMPVSLGTTPLDALYALIDSYEQSKDADMPKPIADDFKRVERLLRKTEDDLDSQIQAEDLLYSNNFTHSPGGSQWHLSGDDGAGMKSPIAPPTEVLTKLRDLNAMQLVVDICSQERKLLQWRLWSEWWKVISDTNHVLDQQKFKDLSTRIDALTKQITNSTQLINTSIKNAQTEFQGRMPQQGASPRYFSQRDPTLLISGIKSGWPVDYLDKLRVRLDIHVITASTPGVSQPPPAEFSAWADSISAKLPKELAAATKNLFSEFWILQDRTPSDSDPLLSSYPLYHDKEGRDSWQGTQPWFPLFAEWEVEYYHIDYTKWELKAVGSDPVTKIKYVLKDGEKLEDTNVRTISGRVLLLPQASLSLETKVNNLFKNTFQPDLQKIISAEDQKALLADLRARDFLSSPLSGFRDHLVTRLQGTHIKPNVRPPGESVRPMAAVIKATQDRLKATDDYSKTLLCQMDTETTTTPYAAAYDFGLSEYHPFKPAAHGQFRFTKLNIIDKFGQAICAFDPTGQTKPSLYPCLSEFYCPQPDPNSPDMATPFPRTVKGSSGTSCEFAQMPPNLNQDARVNAHFMVRDSQTKEWRPTTEYENPIWGWLIVNYVDRGLQIFLPDGTFYTEVRLGARNGTSTAPRWLPFEPSTSDPKNMQQLDYLVQKLADPQYLDGFFKVVIDALDNMPHAPNQYAEYLSAIIGKPLALVNTGWSIELSNPPLENQATIINNKAKSELALLDYQLRVKFGDKARVYDGLVGYFNARNASDGPDFEFSEMYTYFEKSPTDQGPFKLIGDKNYPIFKPYWIPAPAASSNSSPSWAEAAKIGSEFIELHNQQLTVFGMLIDPFTAVHAYSEVLPIQSLLLPQWALEKALKSMTAFFHMGPYIIPMDVPPYAKAVDAEPATTKGIPFPASNVANWEWLQPYVTTKGTDAKPTTNFYQLGVDFVDERPRFEAAPYTAIEGYLRLRTPIEAPTS
ncbi:uncharacterized protein SPPG_06056 [Spizellomyces punctatus DAOM BR117]|uniref:Uncharacterized protein n=1 Tax=Spizellomyces punctatus (strain DAOM BR117) TaxID=645134 RepID=A0A0L0HAW9_SPIPD|nr:uncharacterized protein SPPG_06056 [Spizellomyces punctatus DAOM BR117]KNC98347.1 hypothetical protein SPPG_06056 [Spizellomyces punctatus DAOM BR117]|eukprot:XP_016606387.1 hypothetical protein SPPG_06056 [Spizellomyces punctatus DAOM BR117]